MPEMFEIPGPGLDGRRKAVLDDLFRAQVVVETWARWRRFCARLVILLSAPLAICIWRGMGLAAGKARFALLLWAFAFTAWSVSVVASLLASRELDRRLARAGGRRVLVDRREDR